jgi:phage tail P2-like protein
MIDLRSGGLSDLWPENKDPKFLAISYAIQRAAVKVADKADATGILYQIDSLDEATLDYLAVEYRSMYYDPKASIEQKRSVIKGTISWYAHAGTITAVKGLVTTILGQADVVEWFDYEDPPKTPFTFDIETGGQSTESIMGDITSMIQKVKNARSQIRRVVITREVESAAAASAAIYVMPECTCLNC